MFSKGTLLFLRASYTFKDLTSSVENCLNTSLAPYGTKRHYNVTADQYLYIKSKSMKNLWQSLWIHFYSCHQDQSCRAGCKHEKAAGGRPKNEAKVSPGDGEKLSWAGGRAGEEGKHCIACEEYHWQLDWGKKVTPGEYIRSAFNV